MRSIFCISTLTYFIGVMITGYLVVEVKPANANFLRYKEALKEKIPENIGGFWRETEQSERYIHINLPYGLNSITIYRHNRLYTGGDIVTNEDYNIVSDEDCYHVEGGPFNTLAKAGPETYMMPMSRSSMQYKHIGLIVRDNPDVLWVELDPFSFRKNISAYERERKLKPNELPICS